MARILQTFGIVLISFIAFGASWAFGQEWNHTPTLNQGEKWRVAYYEVGPRARHKSALGGMIEGLNDLGWLKSPDIPVSIGVQDTKGLWKWIVENVTSDFIDFQAANFWSSNWNEDTQEQNLPKNLATLKAEEIDLVWAMGNEGAQDMVSEPHSVPTMFLETNSIFFSDLIDGAEYSGFDNRHALVLKGRYKNQLSFFHGLYEFRSMGVVYENSEEGRLQSAIDALEIIAMENGFKIIPCFARSNVKFISEARSDVFDCVTDLSEKVEAFYFTEQRGVGPDNIGDLTNILHQNGIPTFSQIGASLVKYGVLVSLEPYTAEEVGLFYAETTAKHFNGALLGEIPQNRDFVPRIVLNTGISERYDFDISFDVQSVADTIYRKVLRP